MGKAWAMRVQEGVPYPSGGHLLPYLLSGAKWGSCSPGAEDVTLWVTHPTLAFQQVL